MLMMKPLPASQLRALSGKGTINKHRMTCSMCFNVTSVVQSFFNVFTHISPFSATLGWYIFVRKKPLGGAFGYSFGITNFIRKHPPTNGVPSAKDNLLQIDSILRERRVKESISANLAHQGRHEFQRLYLRHSRRIWYHQWDSSRGLWSPPLF